MMAGPLTDEEIKKYKEAFSLFDMDGNGSITTKELGTVIRALGENPTEAELRAMIDELDSDGSGTLSLSEFMGLMARRTSGQDKEQELRGALKVLDTNHDGFIPATAFRHVMTNVGERLADEEVDEMIREVHVDGDDRINCDEFARKMTSI